MESEKATSSPVPMEVETGAAPVNAPVIDQSMAAPSLCNLLAHEVRGVRDVCAHDFIAAYAEHLKRSCKLPVPKFAEYVKTAHFKELAPLNPDWFYVRVASIARQVYLHQNLGVGALTRKHGGKKRRGSRPNVFARSSGAVERRAMQALQSIGIVKKTNDGRRITSKGMRDLDRVAMKVARSSSA